MSDNPGNVNRDALAEILYGAQWSSIEAIAMEMLIIAENSKKQQPVHPEVRLARVDDLAEAVSFMLTARKRLADSMKRF
jgi:hypothetical protein